MAYRPGGLLAAKLALKHISVVTTEGYAGSPGGAQAKFVAEVGKEEQKRNIDILAEEMTNYRSIRPSGPHAKNLLEFFDTVDGKLTDEQRAAPKIVVNDQELRGFHASKDPTPGRGELLLVHRPLEGTMPAPSRYTGGGQTPDRDV